MTIKKTALSTSIILAMGLTIPAFAETKAAPAAAVDGEAVTIECIPQAEVDLMTDMDKTKLTLPVCEDADAKASDEKNAEEPKTAQ